MAKMSVHCSVKNEKDDQKLVDHLCHKAYDEARYIAMHKFRMLNLLFEQGKWEDTFLSEYNENNDLGAIFMFNNVNNFLNKLFAEIGILSFYYVKKILVTISEDSICHSETALVIRAFK